MARKLWTTKNLGKHKPSITFGRPIARVPAWENEVKTVDGFIRMMEAGYKLYPADLFSQKWHSNTVCSARNAIFEEALERKSDYVFFFDDDMTVIDLPKVIEQMLKLDKDIVGAIGYTKGEPHWPNIAKVWEIGESKTVCDSRTTRIYEWPKDEPFQVDVVGTAVMLIKRKVYEKMEAPWFYMPPNYLNRNIKGEDTTFCFNAKMHGFEIWVDPTIKVGHIGEFPYGEWTSACFENFKESVMESAKKNEPDIDFTHKLVDSVQEEMKKGEGPKRMFV